MVSMDDLMRMALPYLDICKRWHWDRALSVVNSIYIISGYSINYNSALVFFTVPEFCLGRFDLASVFFRRYLNSALVILIYPRDYRGFRPLCYTLCNIVYVLLRLYVIDYNMWWIPHGIAKVASMHISSYIINTKKKSVNFSIIKSFNQVFWYYFFFI